MTGGPCFKYDWWRAWQDSNLQPLGSKPSTLSIELRAHFTGEREERKLGRATGFEPVISCATDRRLRPLGYARHHYESRCAEEGRTQPNTVQD